MERLLLLTMLLLLQAPLLAEKDNKMRAPETIDSILVCKSKHSMTLYEKGKAVKTYDVSIGAEPLGHKQQQGDNRTPEGLYTIHDRNPHSRYYLNLGISYPNDKDRRDAARRGVSTGGDIKIHGYSDAKGRTKERTTKFAYTWGCIGVCNEDMDEIFLWVKTGARILIIP